MADSSTMDFWNYYFQSICTDQCREPLILQLRDALGSIDDSNHEEVVTIVNYLLSEMTYEDTPSTIHELLRELGKLNSRPASGREVVQDEDISELVEKMCDSSVNTPEPTRAEAVAIGLSVPSGFVPSPGNPFYDPLLDLCGAAHAIARISIAAKAVALEWRSMITHMASRFRDYMLKMKFSPRHGVRRLYWDLKHMWEFLDNGRDGWKLITLPHNFYEDVLPVITDFIHAAQHVGLHKDCHPIRELVSLAVDIRKRLRAFQQLRREAEEACRRQYEQEKTEREKTEQEKAELEKREHEVKAEEHIRSMMEKISFFEEPAGLLPVAQQKEGLYTVETAAAELEQMGLMERLEEELDEGEDTRVAPEAGIDDLGFDV